MLEPDQGFRIALLQRANGQSNRFTLVSMIPGTSDEAATATLRSAFCAANGCWPAKETAAALSRDSSKNCGDQQAS